MTTDGDTIVAAATPPGIGGIGIVRISGPDAESIARQLSGSLPEPRHAAYRSFVDARQQKIDAGIVLYFPGPASFTGESVVELHAHGGPVVVSMIVDAAVAVGARRAEPGEFTQRAFLNDKLDLAQAEAVADLIGSGTDQAARAALRSLSGQFSREVDTLALELVHLRTYVEAAIDFPDEEGDFLSDASLTASMDRCGDAFAVLDTRTRAGQVLRDGYRVVIVGRPNAGKSSLLNYLSGEDAAIVTEIAGTTRDVLREQIDIDGLAVELVDTAGLRDDPDTVEAEGIRRARAALAQADAVLWIQDATDTHSNDINEPIPERAPLTVIRNKIDLTAEAPGISSGLDTDEVPVIRLSARTGAGVDVLRDRIRTLAGHQAPGEGTYTARRRHVEALKRAAAHFTTGRQAVVDARGGELAAEEFRLAQAALGEITGAITSDELLGRIFSEFCIGK